MSCCADNTLEGLGEMTPTQQIYAIKAQQPGGGNLASGNTDYVQEQVARGALIRLEATEKPIGAGPCCVPVQRHHPHLLSAWGTGAASSGAHLQARIAEQERCTAQQNLALAKLRRGIPECPPISTNPRLRFAAYERRSAANLCPDIRTNAGVSHAVDGPCTNVIGIVQTWPPH
jgi:hypothetical protein